MKIRNSYKSLVKTCSQEGTLRERGKLPFFKVQCTLDYPCVDFPFCWLSLYDCKSLKSDDEGGR